MLNKKYKYKTKKIKKEKFKNKNINKIFQFKLYIITIKPIKIHKIKL